MSINNLVRIILDTIDSNDGMYRNVGSLLTTIIVENNKQYIDNLKAISDAINNCLQNGWLEIFNPPTGYMQGQIRITSKGIGVLKN